MAEYALEVLHRLWAVEKNIYTEFARICDAHGLRYFCAYGTALGAIRHKGFIPWDDDMDMGMPREDYEKFLQIAPAELGEHFELLEARRTPGYVLPFAKLTRSDTTFVEATDQDRTYHSGIFIDIFPFDLIWEDAAKRDKVEHKCWVLARLCVLSAYKKPKLPSTVTGWKKAVAYFGCGVIHYGLRLFGQTPKRLQERYAAVAATPAKEGATGLYADFVLYRFEDNYGQVDVVYKEETLLPPVQVPFDEITAAVPADWDTYLTQTFGDYMQLPPVDKRHCHTPAKLDFGSFE
jgi:lipopolysaccharide cholinephosphotransferase